MTALTPNEAQQRLIDSTDGIYRVDAGAGTGKTFTVTRRYANIIDQDDIAPEDVLLVTFTNNAASEMRERIVSQSSYGVRELRDAPIQTFHSYCHELLEQYGRNAPQHLDVDDRISGSTRIIDDELVEQALFTEFINRFSDDHPEHHDYLRVLNNPTTILGLIKELAAKGVFPTADGWYRNGRDHLEGDFEAFETLFNEANAARNGGSKQSRLRKALNSFGDKPYLPDAPAKGELRGSRGTKEIPPEVARHVFEADREALITFVHDVYHAYLSFTLSRNYLTFGFLQLFAFVLLCEDESVRETASHEYVMIDEFQDSSEIQFKLALLLADSNNVCVVGDWKQSIYSFQYAAVENITEFDDRLERFVEELNADTQRCSIEAEPSTPIELTRNYRSTQSILDFAEYALTVPASGKDSVDVDAVEERMVSLSSTSEFDHSHIEALQHEDEHEALLTKIQHIVGNDEYAVEEAGELRTPTYGDIAVLTRKHDFGRELLDVADDYGLPVAYEGGVELFRSDQAKLVLAWLRILESDAERGWAPVLEKAGYGLGEIETILADDDYPGDMRSFRAELASLDALGSLIKRILGHYGFAGQYADGLLTTLQSIFDTTTFTRGDLIRFIEQGIDRGVTQEIDSATGDDSVTVQTIHAAKGLEYPIVIMANMNRHKFPASGGQPSPITYHEPVGLRARKVFDDVHGPPHVYDNWRMDIIRKVLPDGYDEERRLLYVAMTRAESHLLFTAGDTPNTFIEELPVSLDTIEPAIEPVDGDDDTPDAFQVSIPERDGPTRISPHALMDDSVYEDVTEGKGKEFGDEVHDFAEAYTLGEDVSPANSDEEHVANLIDSLDGELRPEEDAYLPLEVDGEDVSIYGIVDLLCVDEESVELIDFKTDRQRFAEDEYRLQLSIYWHIAAEVFPEKSVGASLFYTAEGDRVEIETEPLDSIRDRVRRRETRTKSQ